MESLTLETFLARSSPQGLAMANMGLLFMRMLFVALCLYLASYAISNLPALRSYLAQTEYQNLLQIVVIAATIYIVYHVASLRVLHALGLIRHSRVFAWPDIIFSALALARLSATWHYFFRWLERRST